MENYAQRLERLFNQVRFQVEVKNTSEMQAEHLLIEVSVSSGWIHDRFVWVSPKWTRRHRRARMTSSTLSSPTSVPS